MRRLHYEMRTWPACITACHGAGSLWRVPRRTLEDGEIHELEQQRDALGDISSTPVRSAQNMPHRLKGCRRARAVDCAQPLCGILRYAPRQAGRQPPPTDPGIGVRSWKRRRTHRAWPRGTGTGHFVAELKRAEHRTRAPVRPARGGPQCRQDGGQQDHPSGNGRAVQSSPPWPSRATW